jgi:hypothetical protein
MIQLTLVLALLTNLGGEHAALHPKNADVYVEVPDLQAALEAYKQAPVVKTLQGEQVQALLSIVTQLGQDPNTLIDGMLPKPVKGHEEDRWWPWSTITQASLSFAGISADVGQTQAGLPAKPGAFGVIDFADAAAGQEALRVMTSIRPTSVDGAAIDLGARKLATRQITLDEGVEAWLALDDRRLFVAFGASREELAARLVDPKTGFQPRSGPEPLFTPSSGVLLVNIQGNVRKLSAMLGQAPNPLFATRTAQQLIHLASPLIQFVPLIGTQGHWRMELRGDRIVTEGAYVRAGAAKELDAVFGTGPVSPLARAMVSKEAIGAWVTSVKPAQLESTIELWVSELQGLAGGSATSKAEPLPADVPHMSEALGEAAAIFTLPISPTSQTLPFVVSVELKDKELFTRAFEGWCAHQQKLHPELELKQKAYRKTMVYTLTKKGAGAEEEAAPQAPGLGGMGSLESLVKPSLFVWSDRVVLTLSPSIARNEIKRLESKNVEKHAIAAETFGARDAFEISTMDWGTSLAKLYDLARAFLPMMVMQMEEDKKPDLSKLPTGDALFQHFKPTVSWSKRVDGRIYTYTESSFGPEVLVGLVGVATLVVPNVMQGLQKAQSTAASLDHADEHHVHADSKPATDTNNPPVPVRDLSGEATLQALRDVRTGLAVYRNQGTRYPETLEKLLVPTASFPKGFLEGTTVPQDGWKHALVYKPASDGATYVLYSLGPDGTDQQGGGDDVKLP